MPRQINSALVLSILRQRQPISRVDLARVSGLQPSTVSLIVEKLLSDRWVQESEPQRGAMGRRPRLLALSEERCVIAIDIHPHRAALALVDIGGGISQQRDVALPAEPARAIAMLIRAVRSLLRDAGGRKVEGIGICLPGRTDPDATELIFAPNLRWPVVKLRTRLEKATGLPVCMDNVANACALLEVWQSAAPHTDDFVVVEVSEGIGTGIFINGAIARGRGGMAGEFGHLTMDPGGLLCNCGNRGCWETLGSQRAAIRYYSERAHPRRAPAFDRLLELAHHRDPDAISALECTAGFLGRGLQFIAAALAPAEIVIVGDITAAWPLVGPVIEKEMRRHSLARNVRLRASSAEQSARLRSAVAVVHTHEPDLAG